jgi:hypothetical protein
MAEQRVEWAGQGGGQGGRRAGSRVWRRSGRLEGMRACNHVGMDVGQEGSQEEGKITVRCELGNKPTRTAPLVIYITYTVVHCTYRRKEKVDNFIDKMRNGYEQVSRPYNEFCNKKNIN